MSRDSRVFWTEIVKKSMPSTIAASALWMALAEDCPAQSGRKWFGSRPAPVAQPAVPQNGFAATVERLLVDARRQAAEGHVEEAIKTAQRARKIAEASAAVIRDNPNVSMAAADALLRDLSALQQATVATPIVAAPPVPLRQVTEPSDPIEPPAVVTVLERPSPIEETATPVKNLETFVRENPVAAPLDVIEPEAKPTPSPTLAERRVLASSRSQNELRFGDLSSGIREQEADVPAKAGTAPIRDTIDVVLPQTSVELGQPAPITAPVVLAPAPAGAVIAGLTVKVREPQSSGWETAVEPSSESSELELPTVELGMPQSFPPAVPVKPLAMSSSFVEHKETDVVERSVTVWANRTGSTVVGEPAGQLLSSTTAKVEQTPPNLESAAVPIGSEPRIDESTDWNSAEPASPRRHGSAALLDTAWERDGGPSEANDARAEPAVFGPSANVPSATSNSPSVAVVIEPLSESDVVTPVGFTPSASVAAPPPPSELEPLSAVDVAVALDSDESVSGPAVRTRESISASVRSSITASFVDQLAARWRLPAQTLVAGFAAAGLLLLGLGVSLLRVATRPIRH